MVTIQVFSINIPFRLTSSLPSALAVQTLYTSHSYYFTFPFYFPYLCFLSSTRFPVTKLSFSCRSQFNSYKESFLRHDTPFPLSCSLFHSPKSFSLLSTASSFSLSLLLSLFKTCTQIHDNSSPFLSLFFLFSSALSSLSCQSLLILPSALQNLYTLDYGYSPYLFPFLPLPLPFP